MAIPQASINDLVATHNNAGNPQSNPVSGFINMLSKYAQPAISAIQSNPQVQQIENSPVGQLVQGHFGNIIPAAKQEFADLRSGKYQPQINFGGEMEEVPGLGFSPETGLPKIGGQSIESMNDAANGWQTGQKGQFDQALANGDSETVRKMLPDVPDYYKTKMDDRIQSVMPKFAYDNTPSAEIPAGGEQLPIPGTNKAQGLPPISDNPESGGSATLAPEKPPMITKNQADPQTIAKMSLNFDVPRRIAQNQMVKPETVMNQLLDDGVSGKNLNDLQNTADSITGEKGAFPQINNYILKSIKDPIDYGDALNAKNTNLPSVMAGEKEGFINTINQEVNKAMEPLNYNKPGQLPSDLPEGQAYAPDLFQTSQNLQRISRMYMRKAYTDMGELNHPEMERAANAITEIKNNIDDAIDKNVPSGTYQAFKSDPFVQSQLQRVPPKVAQRWLAGADRFKDGQTIQAPYVNLSHMIEDTKDTQLSVWTKAAKAMQGQNVSGNVANTVKENIPGPKILKNTLGGIAGKVAQPFDKTPEDIFQENMSGKGTPGGGKFPGGTTGKVIAAGGLLTGGTLLGMEMKGGNQKSNAYGDGVTKQTDDSHKGSITSTPLSVNNQNNQSIETDMSKIDASSQPADPRSITGNDGKSLALDPGTYVDAMTKLDDLTKTDPSYITNPIKAGQLASAKDIIQKKSDQSAKLLSSYNKTSLVTQKIADAQSLVKDGAPWLSDKIGFLEGAHEMVSPKYQSLVNDLNFIENSDPRLKGQLSNLATGGSVKTALDNAAKLLLSEHNQLLKSYGAGMPESTAGKVTTPSQIPAGLPAPVDGGLPTMQHTGTYQFTAPNPMFQ